MDGSHTKGYEGEWVEKLEWEDKDIYKEKIGTQNTLDAGSFFFFLLYDNYYENKNKICVCVCVCVCDSPFVFRDCIGFRDLSF